MNILKNWEQFNEAKIVVKDTTKTDFNVKSLIQLVDENDKNCGQATITKVLKSVYNVNYKNKDYKIKRSDLSLNTHGQLQANKSDLIS